VRTPGEFDPNAQIAAINAVIQRKVDLIIIWPLDPDGNRPSLDKAREAGIPIIVQDSPKSKPYLTNVNFTDFEDVSASGAIASVGGNFRPVVTGMDGTTLEIESIRKGRQFATMALPSVELGNGLAYAAWLHLAGRSVPREINGQQNLVYACE